MLKKIQVRSDHRGTLIVFEENENLNFKPIRIYLLMSNSSNEARGFHAHHKLNQLIVCLAGSCAIKTIDRDLKPTIYNLKSIEMGLSIGPYTWREITFMSKDCILLVNCDRNYEKEDYIHDFKQFKKICQTL